jgi:hypothetical protein
MMALAGTGIESIAGGGPAGLRHSIRSDLPARRSAMQAAIGRIIG